jgi:hypothetical protein
VLHIITLEVATPNVANNHNPISLNKSAIAICFSLKKHEDDMQRLAVAPQDMHLNLNSYSQKTEHGT